MYRSTIALLLLAAAGSAASAPITGAMPCARVYVGTQDADRGVYAATLVARTGQLSPPRVVAPLPRPTWLLADPHRPMLYATSDPRDQPGATPLVVAFAIDPASGELRRLGAGSPGGQGPTFLSLDPASRTLFVALYGSGQVSALPLDADGQLSPPASVQTDTGSVPSPRQTSAHAHAAVPDPTGRFVLVPDLGADRLFVYRYDPRRRALAPATTPFLQLPPGTGPRHLVFAPDRRTAYLVSELSAEVRTLRWNPAGGTLAIMQTVPIAAAAATGPRSASEIAVSRDGRFVYVGDRGTDSIVVFAIDRRTGMLTEIQRAPTGGKTPWSFALSPDSRWMIVANQASDTIAVLPRDPSTGRLAASAGQARVSKPVTIAFASPGTRC